MIFESLDDHEHVVDSDAEQQEGDDWMNWTALHPDGRRQPCSHEAGQTHAKNAANGQPELVSEARYRTQVEDDEDKDGAVSERKQEVVFIEARIAFTIEGAVRPNVDAEGGIRLNERIGISLHGGLEVRVKYFVVGEG